ncbi:MAG: hypothetical protein ACODAJ_16175, partial [Planctomycetota bacterium]
MSQPSAPTFRSAARRAARRLLLARWLSLLARTAAPVFLTAAALLALWRLSGGRWTHPLHAGAVVLAWLGAAGLWTWLRRPSPAEALAVWDARADRHEAFLSAWCFETKSDLDAGERLHLAREQRRLGTSLPDLRKLIPLAASWLLLLPAGFVGFSVSGVLVRPLPPEDRAVDAEARQRAANEAEHLDEDKKDLEEMDELNNE